MILPFDYTTHHKENWLFKDRYSGMDFIESIRSAGSFDAGLFKLIIPRLLKFLAEIYALEGIRFGPRGKVVNVIAVPHPDFSFVRSKYYRDPSKIEYTGFGLINTLYVQSPDLKYADCILDVLVAQIKVSKLATGCYFVLSIKEH